MTIKEFNEAILEYPLNEVCMNCRSRQAEIMMMGYSKGDIRICKECATQLARKLLEDICDLNGDRHG